MEEGEAGVARHPVGARADRSERGNGTIRDGGGAAAVSQRMRRALTGRRKEGKTSMRNRKHSEEWDCGGWRESEREVEREGSPMMMMAIWKD